MPTIIVHGDADETVPVQQSIKAQKLISNCRLEIIKGADHNFSKPEDFERMLGYICKFVVSK